MHIVQTCNILPTSAQTLTHVSSKKTAISNFGVGGSHLERTKERWNFNTVQGQQLAKKQRGGKMYNSFQIDPAVLLIAAFVVRRGILFLFKQ